MRSTLLFIAAFSLRCFAVCSVAVALTATAAEPAETAEAESAGLGRRLADLLNAGKVDDVMSLFDAESFGVKFMKQLGATDAQLPGLRQQIAGAVRAAVVKQLEPFNQARFLRVQSEGAERRALVRLVGDSPGVGYCAFIGRQRGPDDFVWDDYYNYATGETVLQTIYRAMVPLIATRTRGLASQLAPVDSIYIARQKEILHMNRLQAARRSAEAWAIAQDLPTELQKHRPILIMRMHIAQHLDELKYLRVIEEWRDAYPNDPCLDFMALDRAIIVKNFEAAVDLVDIFAKRIGGDGYLDFLATGALIQLKRHDEAQQRARKAVTVDPKLREAWDVLLLMSLRLRNYAEVAAALNELGANFPETDLDALVAKENYSSFRQSPAGSEWRTARKARVAEKPGSPGATK